MNENEFVESEVIDGWKVSRWRKNEHSPSAEREKDGVYVDFYEDGSMDVNDIDDYVSGFNMPASVLDRLIALRNEWMEAKK